MSLEQLLNQFQTLWAQAVEIWISGGWAMIAIAVTAMIMFGFGVHVHLRLLGKGFSYAKEKTWRRWIDHPEERKGAIGELLDFVSGASTMEESVIIFDELHTTEIAPFERDLKVMRICVSAAPLLGLLGTVTGILSTFAALSSGAGGAKTMEMVAQGISEALVTTETGLAIALPGLFHHYVLAGKLERYKAFLSHVQTVCTQKIYRDIRKKEAA
jgi:biopolymer transport protein ExbB